MKLSALKDLYADNGPFATAYLDASRTSESGAAEVERRWRALRDQLERDGAGQALLERMTEHAEAPVDTPGPCTRVIVGAGGRVVLDRVLPDRPMRDEASWAELPDLIPMLQQQERSVPHALVSIGRGGADIWVYGASGSERERTCVEGDTENLSKSRGGNWAHRSMQARTEEKWGHNAREVADELDRLVRSHGLNLVVVAGDERAAALLEREASDATRPLLRRIEGSFDVEGDREVMAERVRDLLASAAHYGAERALQTFEQERGRHGAAAEGIGGVVDALRRAQVATLLVGPTLGAEGREIHVSDDPMMLAVRDDDLADLGAEHVRSAPAGAAILRAAVASDADVMTVESDGALRDGVAALLRYSDPSTVTA